MEDPRLRALQRAIAAASAGYGRRLLKVLLFWLVMLLIPVLLIQFSG